MSRYVPNTMQVIMKHPNPRMLRELVAEPDPHSAPVDLVKIVKPDYPHITDRVTLLWGTSKLQQYLTKLLITCDHPDCHEFSIRVTSALLKIYVAHIKIAPLPPVKATEPPLPQIRDTLYDVWEYDCR